ncbi:MAG: rhamnulokinase [Desulfobacteraceae bacterium]|nr:rhamnulokinase [Desulfobacteraceae bacterium]
MSRYLAFDLGASSGRAIAGHISEGEHLSLQEIHRFPTGMINVNDSWYWNIFGFFQEMKTGLTKYNDIHGSNLDTIAIDTWGVDFGLVAGSNEILGIPYAYRDKRTDGVPDSFFELIDKRSVYEMTGIQVMQFNSLYQLYAMVRNKSPLLDSARSLLFIPDLLNFLFTGVKATEFSFAATSQMYNPIKSRWEQSFFDAMGLSSQLMNEIVVPGAIIGNLRDSIKKETGSNDLRVVSTISHDTGAAVAAIPAQGENWAYISSGTWSLMGVETDCPVITDRSYEYNFSNEGGVNGTFRLQKNITGLWILEQFKNSNKILSTYDYERLIGRASNKPEFISVIDPNDKRFLNPPNMGEAIENYLRITDQKVPESASSIVRIILESLAFKYRQTLDMLRQICPNPIEKIHITGGGSKNYLLNQFTANATGLPVITGPLEGTAIGNIITQAISDKSITDIVQGRAIIKKCVKLKTFEPRNTDNWNTAYEKSKKIIYCLTNFKHQNLIV